MTGKRVSVPAGDVSFPHFHDANTVSLVFMNTYVYKDRLDALGVGGGRINVTDNSRGDYVRFMKSLDVSKDDEKVEEVFKAMKNIASGP